MIAKTLLWIWNEQDWNRVPSLAVRAPAGKPRSSAGEWHAIRSPGFAPNLSRREKLKTGHDAVKTASCRMNNRYAPISPCRAGSDLSMPNTPTSGTPLTELIQMHRMSADVVRTELTAGILARQACIAPKFLYDALGSKLFEAICELPEYYLTRTEAAVFDAHLPAIAASIGQGGTLIDLGAGNCAKAARLFAALQPAQYVPVDISANFLRDALSLLRQRFPEIKMTGLGLDFSETLDLPDAVRRERRLFFYPGSSIGNFTPEQAVAFLRRVHAACGTDRRAGGALLIGVDLIKDRRMLEAAYDDALGVTAAFNLNLLRHLNALLQADFDVREWTHRACFNADQNRIEMHLEAARAVDVSWPGGRRRFEEGERIHTENSYKYTREDFVMLLERAGFGHVRCWTDAQGWFMVCHAQAI
ncbi:MAG TPA: L-histidine N(alpha)-methyltransferase [Burkholderiaceae bacterium]|nr:L-histidine N(alpha)-methyltransferase [Burkholderiaceae bacterium]